MLCSCWLVNLKATPPTGGGGKNALVLVVTKKNALVLVVTQKNALVLVVTPKSALVLVVIAHLVVTQRKQISGGDTKTPDSERFFQFWW